LFEYVIQTNLLHGPRPRCSIPILQALLPDQRTDVLFVGYQDQGTLGRDIQKYGPTGGYVYLDGKGLISKRECIRLWGIQRMLINKI